MTVTLKYLQDTTLDVVGTLSAIADTGELLYSARVDMKDAVAQAAFVTKVKSIVAIKSAPLDVRVQSAITSMEGSINS